MNPLRLAMVGVVVSVVILVVISISSGVDFDEIGRVGVVPFAIASSVSILRLFLQGLRFHILIRSLVPNLKVRWTRSITVRVASEFLALSTVAYMGGEVLRIAWLKIRGVQIGKAAWVNFVDIFLDVIVGGSVSLLAALYSGMRGAYLLATGISVIVVFTVVVSLAIYIFGRRRISRTPKKLATLSNILLGKRRGGWLVGKIDDNLMVFSDAAQKPFGVRNRVTLTLALLCTVALPLAAGVTFNEIFAETIPGLNIVTSTFTVYASIAISTLPISLGGSGLSEAGAFLYSSQVLGVNSWAQVIVWRIASYHIPLAASAVALAYVMVTELKTNVQISGAETDDVPATPE